MNEQLSIVLCSPVSEEDLARARSQFPQCDWRQASKDTEARDIASADIVYGKPGEAALAQARELKWLQAPSAGVERLAASTVFLHGSFTLTTASGMHESCAEHAIALLLSFSRCVGQHARLQETLHWNSRAQVPTPLVLQGRTLGILGMGAIGRRVAELARALGMRTIGVNYSGRSVPEAEETHPVEKLDELLPRFDALIMILPATKETDRILNAERIAKLPRHCIVVNVGRGNAIDEPALIAALRENRLGGAALDVFAQEPLPTDSPFYTLPNVILTPHIGGNRPDYDHCAFGIFLDNLTRFIAGQPLRNVVERGRGY